MTTDRAPGLRVLVADDEPPSRARLVRALGEHVSVAGVDEAADGPAALAALRSGAYDLALLDIEMPGMDGLSVVAELPVAERPCVVFVTAHGQYALDAFDVEAMDFLAKPWSRERLSRVVDRAAAAAGGESLVLRTGGRATVVAPDEIVAATAARNYVRVRCGDGDDEHLSRETLTELEERLPPGRFVRVHRSTIVRIGALRRLDFDEAGEPRVTLADGTAVRVGRTRLDAVRRALGIGGD